MLFLRAEVHTATLINLKLKLCFNCIPMDWNRQLRWECKHNQFWEWFPHPASTLLLARDPTLLPPLSLRSEHLYSYVYAFFILASMSFEYLTFTACRPACMLLFTEDGSCNEIRFTTVAVDSSGDQHSWQESKISKETSQTATTALSTFPLSICLIIILKTDIFCPNTA